MIVAPPLLRPYQAELLDRVRDQLRAGVRRVVLVAVTGAGKTVMAGDMIRSAVERSRRVLFLAHRAELIDQASRKLAAFGVRHGIIKSGVPADPLASVQVASVQTLSRRLARPERAQAPGWGNVRLPSVLDPFDLVVIDECHHATAAGYRAVLDAYPGAVVIGLTATPYRLDGSGLGDIFEAIEAGPQIPDLIDGGYLVPPRVYAPPPPAELAQMRLRAGDYSIDSAERILDQTAPIDEIVAAWRLRAAGRTTVGFACTVGHAEHCAAAFRAAGIPSVAIDGATLATERAAALDALARREVLAVWNCMLLTEGWDLPSCSAVILARPTMSRALWRQMVGRGLRADQGKMDCVVLDHVGSVYRFGMPEEPDEYSLDGEVRAEEGPGRGGGILICADCGAVVGRLPCCPACGWVVPMTAAPERAVDERRTLDLAPARHLGEDERRQIYWDLLSKARERGYSDGWAAHRYRERFGRYPLRPWAEAYQLECA